MAHGHVVAVHGTQGPVAAFVGREVGHDLMAVEVEVDPLGRAAAFRTSEQFAIEGTCFGDVAHGKSEVERDACFWWKLMGFIAWTSSG
jgi:hypothetical protein